MAVCNNRKWQVDIISSIQSDKLEEVNKGQNIYLAYNGSGFFVPLLPPSMALFVKELSQFNNLLSDLESCCEGMLDIVPSCPLVDRFKMFKSHLAEWNKFVQSIRKEDGSGQLDISLTV